MTSAVFVSRYGPWALIIGASEGLGLAFATACAARGLNLVLVARRAEALVEASHSVRAAYPRCEVQTIVADCSQPGAIDDLAKQTAEIDLGLIVYNAALSPIGPLAKQDPAMLETTIRLNCLGPVLAARTFWPRLSQRGHGGLIIMSSMAGVRGSAGLATYAASKAFLSNLAESLWAEGRPVGIDVLACQAGAIATPGFLRASGATASTKRPAFYVSWPAEVAETALRHLGRGPRVIPGFINKLGAFMLQKIFSPRAGVTMMSKASGGLGE